MCAHDLQSRLRPFVRGFTDGDASAVTLENRLAFDGRGLCVHRWPLLHLYVSPAVMFSRDSPPTGSGALQFSGSYPQTRFVTLVTEYLRGTQYPSPT